MPMFRICGVRKEPISERLRVTMNRPNSLKSVPTASSSSFFSEAPSATALRAFSARSLEVLVAGRHAHVVEAIVGAQRVGGIHLVASRAAGLAVEQFQARLGLGRDGRRIAVEEPAERGVHEDQRPLEGRDGPANVLVVHFPTVGLLEGLLIFGHVANGLQARSLRRACPSRPDLGSASWPGGPGSASGRPRRTICSRAALSVVGAFRLPSCPWIPSETAR